jgi:hypothetical protein
MAQSRVPLGTNRLLYLRCCGLSALIWSLGVTPLQESSDETRSLVLLTGGGGGRRSMLRRRSTRGCSGTEGEGLGQAHLPDKDALAKKRLLYFSVGEEHLHSP